MIDAMLLLAGSRILVAILVAIPMDVRPIFVDAMEGPCY